MKRVRAVLLTLGALAFVLPALATAAARTEGDSDQVSQAKSGTSTPNVYIVRMADNPAVAYTGGVPGLRATKPAKGQKIDPNAPDVTRYVAYLDGKHNGALASVGGGRKFYDYRYTLNGFSAQLSKQQAQQMESVEGVVSVERSEIVYEATSNTPDFLGLTGANGAWADVGGVGKAGEDIIIGMLDSGTTPENFSFSDRTGEGPNGQPERLDYQQIPGWHGKCTPGEAFNASMCNQKLIGAQWFNEVAGPPIPEEFVSARDFGGHGTHTASTAGGNNNVPVVGDPSQLGVFVGARISGIAPRARIAVYKGLWEVPDHSTSSGTTADLAAAVDQAVADGVDVINYSISGTSTNFLDAVEVAFLFAADAGVFVSAAAGNAGTAASVNHPSPWLTTVAASTHNRTGVGSMTLGNGTTINGASLNVAMPSKPMILASDAARAGANPAEAALCFAAVDAADDQPTLDPAKVAGKIVVCNRGSNVLVNKSAAVAAAGGAGAVIANVAGGATTTLAILHSVPTLHVAVADGDIVRAYAATPNPTGTLNQSQLVFNVPAPNIASFSSRGPSRATFDQLKPDIAAPGEDILAAFSPADGGKSFDVLSGTSMATPHIAGAAAIVMQAHRDWTPDMVKSALMTTASNLLSPSAFNQGAGQMQLKKALDPGLVYRSGGFPAYVGFICGTGQLTGSICNGLTMDPSDLNLPSIAVGDLAGKQTVKRSVTNVGRTPATYTGAVTGLIGVNAVVSPSSLTLNPGETGEFTVSLTYAGVPFNAFNTGGFLTWTESGGPHVVRSPVVIRAVAIAAPNEVRGTGSTGSLEYKITTGYDGALALGKRGLVPANETNATVTDDPANSFSPTGQGVTKHEVTVPAGTRLARFSLFDDRTDGNDDLDLYVFNKATGVQVGASGGPTSEEQVDITPPAGGATYEVYVHGFATDGPDANYTLFDWALGSVDAGNMTATLTPPNAATGEQRTVNVSWTLGTTGKRWLGAIDYLQGSTLHGTTLVRIDN